MLLTKTIIADDHALVRAGLRDALASLPEIEVLAEVANGPDLLQTAFHLRPDLVVMDVNMPNFEPVEAVKKIRSQLPEVKILVVSAYDDQSYVVGLLAAGVNGYHLKDQPLSDLQMAVQRILQGGRWISDPLVDRLVTHQETAQPAHALSRRQRELLYYLSQGYNNQKIALMMDLSVKTVENHLTALYRALGVESRLEANTYALHHPEQVAIPEEEKRHNEQNSETFSALVVDDNPRYRTQLAKLIRKTHPFTQVYDAEDTPEAVKIAQRVAPHLALIDVVLGEEDGIECARRIRAVSALTRMVVMSAYPDREFRRLALGAGAIAFLDKKDIDAATMRQLVEDALASPLKPG